MIICSSTLEKGVKEKVVTQKPFKGIGRLHDSTIIQGTGVQGYRLEKGLSKVLDLRLRCRLPIELPVFSHYSVSIYIHTALDLTDGSQLKFMQLHFE